MSANKSIKKRYWAFVLYPESAPADWLDILQASGLPCAVSPLHDKDLNADGEPKKAHHHIILAYSGPTTFNSVNSFVSSLNCPIPIPLESVRGMYRYFTHMDNPEKYQYSDVDIRCINGFSVADFVELTKSEVHNIIIAVEKLIVEKNFFEYCDVSDFLRDSCMITEHHIFTSHTMHFTSYLRSRRHSHISSNKVCVDSDTGEVLE